MCEELGLQVRKHPTAILLNNALKQDVIKTLIHYLKTVLHFLGHFHLNRLWSKRAQRAHLTEFIIQMQSMNALLLEYSKYTNVIAALCYIDTAHIDIATVQKESSYPLDKLCSCMHNHVDANCSKCFYLV